MLTFSIYIAVFAIFLLIFVGEEIFLKNPGPEMSLSILHLNIRSIRNKISYIEDTFLDFNILCFTETHLTNLVSTSSLLLKGFGAPYRKDKSPHSGGILIYVAEHILSERVENLENFWEETIWIKIKNNCDQFLLCTLYRPPNSANEFWELLNGNLEMALDMLDNIILIGDLNEDQLNANNRKLKRYNVA